MIVGGFLSQNVLNPFSNFKSDWLNVSLKKNYMACNNRILDFNLVFSHERFGNRHLFVIVNMQTVHLDIFNGDQHVINKLKGCFSYLVLFPIL